MHLFQTTFRVRQLFPQVLVFFFQRMSFPFATAFFFLQDLQIALVIGFSPTTLVKTGSK
jgi:hypothetical protein